MTARDPNLQAARRALESAKLCGVPYAKTTGHFDGCDRFGLEPEQDRKGEEVTYCTCMMGLVRGLLGFVDQAIEALDAAGGEQS